MPRTPFIAGNWKMYGASSEASELAQGVVEALGAVSGVDVAVAPPFTALETVRAAIEGSAVTLAA